MSRRIGRPLLRSVVDPRLWVHWSEFSPFVLCVGFQMVHQLVCIVLSSGFSGLRGSLIFLSALIGVGLAIFALQGFKRVLVDVDATIKRQQMIIHHLSRRGKKKGSD